MKYVRMTVRGEVQGVNLRYKVKEKAKELGITGYVKNVSDGSVYIEAAGEDSALDRLADWLRSDPGSAKVDEVRVRAATGDDYVDFSVR